MGNANELLGAAYDYTLQRYGANGYAFWKDLIGSDPIEFLHPTDSGVTVELEPFWDEVRPGGAIRVSVSLFELRPQRFRVRVPCASFLVFEDEHIKSWHPSDTYEPDNESFGS